MKKILLIGKLNTVVNETNQFLSQYFHVQLCSENAGVLEGMLKIVNPDLVVISLMGDSGSDHRDKGGERPVFQVLSGRAV